MQLGVVGLGRMGRIMTERVLDAGHDVVAFDLDEAAVASSVRSATIRPIRPSPTTPSCIPASRRAGR